jgi:signal transduction histidine kinase
MSETPPLTDSERPGRRRWHVESWPLQWKVIALLVVPVTVAMMLGTIRMADDLNDAQHFTKASEQVGIVPGLVDLANSLGTTVGLRVADEFDTSETELLLKQSEDAVINAELDEDIRAELEASFADIRELLPKLRKNPPSDTWFRKQEVAILDEEERAITGELAKTVTSIIERIDDPSVRDNGSLLASAWQAQRQLFAETMALADVMYDLEIGSSDPAGVARMSAATGGELSLLDLMEGFVDDPASFADLRRSNEERYGIVARGALAASVPFPIDSIKVSILSSLAIYSTYEDEAITSIVTFVNTQAAAARSAALRDTAVLSGTVLFSLVGGLLMSRALLSPLRRLRFGTLKAARRDLPAAIANIKTSGDRITADFEQVEVESGEEIGQLARAVDDMHAQALRLAGEQAMLRLQINDMFETLARRHRTLLDQQLEYISLLERDEEDPGRLDWLFHIDHAAAKMRRNSENLLVLAGGRSKRSSNEPLSFSDVVRGAVSRVEDYPRVLLGISFDGAVDGSIANDMTHLIAELVDNALRASESTVEFKFDPAVDGGVLIEIIDRGIGLPPAKLKAINASLSSGGEIGPDTARHMGLFVVSRLAVRHNLTVRLRPSFDQDTLATGVTATVHVPEHLLVHLPSRRTPQMPEVVNPPRSSSSSSSSSIDYTQPRQPANVSATDVTEVRPPLPKREPRSSVGDYAPTTPKKTAQHSDSSSVNTGAPTGGTPLPEGLPPLPRRGGGTPIPPPAGPRPLVDDDSLPTRRPGASGVSAFVPENAPATASIVDPVPTQPWSLPADVTGTLPVIDGVAADARSRYRANAAKTASFFVPRAEAAQRAQHSEAPAAAPVAEASAVEVDSAATKLGERAETNGNGSAASSLPAPVSTPESPIFADMMSSWLTDPTSDEAAAVTWESAADDSWRQADRVASEPVEIDPEIGLPRRHPGERLLPGAIDSPRNDTGSIPRLRNPEAIRAKLSRHQQAVRDGRAGRSFSPGLQKAE